jgi:thiol reductant ABC exporter CydC subunit
MKGTLRRVVDMANVSRGRVGVAVVLGALTVVFGAGLMATAGYLISRAAEHPPVLSLTVAIVLVRFFGLSRPVARYLERLASHDVALRSLTRIRRRFYERLEPLAPGGLEQYRRGELLGRMVGDVDALLGVYLRGIVPPLVALLAGAVCVGAAAAILPAAAAVLAAGLLVGALAVPSLAGRLNRSAGASQTAARAELTAELVELLRGAPELVVYSREEETLARVRSLDARLARLGRRDALVTGLGDALSLLVAGLTATGVLAVAVSATSTGTLDRVLVAALALLALASFEGVAPLPGTARELVAIRAAGRRVLEIADREPAVADPGDPLPAPSGAAVAFESVTARYGTEAPVLDGFSLRLDQGRRIALIGPSGAGKTTALGLLLRFLDPVEGRVTLDGRDVRDYRQEDVRRAFAVAGQDAHIFDTTIRNNLLIARPDATDGELEDALRLARLPASLESMVGEEGSSLSGGERRRLTVARALLADAPVLLLDEPTAHLDPETASALMDDVLDASTGKTVLLVTHRTEGLDRMDEIVVLGAS